MLRNLQLWVFCFVIPFMASAQEPCEVVFDLFGQDTACLGSDGFYLPPVAPFGGTYSGENVSSDGFFNPNGLVAGIYEVTYTADTNVCLGSASAFIEVLEPTPFTLTGTFDVCRGDSAVISSLEGYELIWYDNSRSTSIGFLSDTSFIGYATYTNEGGCEFTQEFSVYVSDFDRLELLIPNQICYNEEIAMQIENATAFSWQIDDTSDNPRYAVFNQDTTIAIKVFVGVCDTVIHYPIEVADSIIFELVTDTTLCPGQLAVVEGVGNALSYRLDGYGDFTDSLVFELTDDALIYATATGEFGCTDFTLINYIVDDYPPLAVTFPDSICQTYPFEIFASGALEYVWKNEFTGDTLFTGDQQDVQLVADQSLDWSITGFSQYGCALKQDVDIYVDPTPEVRIDTLTAFCLGRPILLQGNGAFQYSWSNGFVGDTLEFEGATDTVFSVIGATALGCVNYDTLAITVHEVPVVTAFGEASICEGDTATVTAIGAASYIWGGVLEGETVDLTPIVDSAVSFVGYTVYGCADFSIFNINVDPAPSIEFIGPTQICEGDSASLEVFTDGFITWSDGSLSSVIPVTPTDDTTYSVTSIGGNGCPLTASYAVIVYPYPQLTFDGPTALCYGDTATVTLAGADVFTWSNGLQGDSVTFRPQGSQTILIYGSNDEGCTTIYPYVLTVHPVPQVQFVFSADTLCESGSGISWTASPSGGVLSGDGVVNNWFNLASALNGINTVSYTVANEFNCEASATDELIVETCLNMDHLSATGLELFPNPASNEVRLKWPGEAFYIVRSQHGQVIEKGRFSGIMRIDIASWSPGIYMLEVCGNQRSETVRLVKQ
jgi:hypothetical protein